MGGDEVIVEEVGGEAVALVAEEAVVGGEEGEVVDGAKEAMVVVNGVTRRDSKGNRL